MLITQTDQQKMATSNHHEWYITTSLAFSSLKICKFTFTQRPLPGCADLLLLLDVLIIVKYREFQLLPLSDHPPPEDSKPLEEPLRTHSVFCCPHHLLPSPTCQAWVLLCSCLQKQMLSILLTSSSDAPSSAIALPPSSTMHTVAFTWTVLPA